MESSAAAGDGCGGRHVGSRAAGGPFRGRPPGGPQGVLPTDSGIRSPRIFFQIWKSSYRTSNRTGRSCLVKKQLPKSRDTISLKIKQ